MNPPQRRVARIFVLWVARVFAAGWMLTHFSTHALERLEPAQGCYFGVNLGAGDTIAQLTSRLGIMPAIYVQFFDFPLSPVSRGQVDTFLSEVRAHNGIAMVTLEPSQGLATITESECLDFARLCATNEARGLEGILIRFAHEMNGNWYPWCQQPILFKEKFRLLAQIVHTNTARTAMLWAPNNGIGYPYAPSGAYQAPRGSADFAALDTDGDGQLTTRDDMYEPYYPGDDAVDWVGMTVYHWGASYPWLENEMPLPNAFANTLRGTVSQPPIPDFYARYCSDGVHNKPLAIPETAAFFNTQQSADPGEFQIKQAWWRQVFNAFDDNTNAANIAVEFPKLKCINWFDHFKSEAEAQGEWIDWRISANPMVREAFVMQVRTKRQGQAYFLTAQECACLRRSDCIITDDLPRVLPLTGTVTVSLTVKAQAKCDLVVDLLDDRFQWHGGTRAVLVHGTQMVTVSFPITAPLSHGQKYRWSVFLTPTGSNYLGAFLWHETPSPLALDRNQARLRTAFIGGQLTLNWDSITTCQYQVFETADASSQWVPLGTWLNGTGTTLQIPVTPSPAATRRFYRLQIFPR